MKNNKKTRCLFCSNLTSLDGKEYCGKWHSSNKNTHLGWLCKKHINLLQKTAIELESISIISLIKNQEPIKWPIEKENNETNN